MLVYCKCCGKYYEIKYPVGKKTCKNLNDHSPSNCIEPSSHLKKYMHHHSKYISSCMLLLKKKFQWKKYFVHCTCMYKNFQRLMK